MKGCGGWFFGDDRLEYRCGETLWEGDKIRLCSRCREVDKIAKNLLAKAKLQAGLEVN